MSKTQQILSMTEAKALLAAATAMKIQELEMLVQELSGALSQKVERQSIPGKELLRLLSEAILDKKKGSGTGSLPSNSKKANYQPPNMPSSCSWLVRRSCSAIRG